VVSNSSSSGIQATFSLSKPTVITHDLTTSHLMLLLPNEFCFSCVTSLFVQPKRTNNAGESKTKKRQIRQIMKNKRQTKHHRASSSVTSDDIKGGGEKPHNQNSDQNQQTQPRGDCQN